MAYTATVTVADKAKRMGPGVLILRGSIDVTEYAATKVAVTGITGRFRTVPTVILGGATDNGYIAAWDATNSAVKAWAPTAGDADIEEFGSGVGNYTAVLTDDDSAASNGVAVYVHVDAAHEALDRRMGHMEFVSPTDTDGSIELSNGVNAYTIHDDDAAATTGVALYFDEDATAGSRLLANTGFDVYIPTVSGELLKITANADPGTPGVQVYLDEDATNAYERLLFVSPTDASGYDYLGGAELYASAGSEAPDGTDVGSVPFLAVGAG